MGRTLFKAKYLYPVSQPIMEYGAMLVDESGKILKVARLDDFSSEDFENTEVKDYNQALIMPGMINAHTHLEYTAVGKINAKSFVDFLVQSLEKIRGWNENKVRESIKMGIKQCLDYGVTTVADVSRWGISPLVLSEYPMLADVAFEAFSFDDASSEKVYARLVEKIKYVKTLISDNINLSISPHSPYNAAPVLWEKVIKYTLENNMLIHTHLAESLEEKKWFDYGNSDIDELHRLIGWEKITPEITSMSAVEYMSTLQLLSTNLIAAHLTFATLRDLEILEDRSVGIVVCPRSNINLHQKVLDYNLLKHLKIKAMIGTDGTSSAGNLNLLEDVRLYNSKFAIPFEDLVKMVTLNPAKHLKMDHLVGSLSQGKHANFIVFDQIDIPANWINYNKPTDVYINGQSMFSITKNSKL